MVAPISAGFGAFKNEFSMFWSTSVPNSMLVDKSALKSHLGPRLLNRSSKGSI